MHLNLVSVSWFHFCKTKPWISMVHVMPTSLNTTYWCSNGSYHAKFNKSSDTNKKMYMEVLLILSINSQFLVLKTAIWNNINSFYWSHNVSELSDLYFGAWNRIHFNVSYWYPWFLSCQTWISWKELQNINCRLIIFHIT